MRIPGNEFLTLLVQAREMICSGMEIRFEIEIDFAEVRTLHLSAFPTAEESDLVDVLRRDGDAVLSLVGAMMAWLGRRITTLVSGLMWDWPRVFNRPMSGRI